MMTNKRSIQFGIIAGIAYCLGMLLLYFIDRHLFGSLWKVVPFLIILIMAAYSAYVRRQTKGNHITFREALKASFIVCLIAEAMGQVFNYSLYNFIDPELSTFIKEMTVSKSKAMYENWNITEEEISKRIEQLKQQNFSLTVEKVGIGFAFWLIIEFIYSCIVAAIIKKAPQETEGGGG